MAIRKVARSAKELEHGKTGSDGVIIICGFLVFFALVVAAPLNYFSKWLPEHDIETLKGVFPEAQIYANSFTTKEIVHLMKSPEWSQLSFYTRYHLNLEVFRDCTPIPTLQHPVIFHCEPHLEPLLSELCTLDAETGFYACEKKDCFPIDISISF